jgi:hypothetical protein
MNSLEISTVKHATFDDTCLQMKVVPKIVDYSKVRPVPADAFVPQNRLMSFGIKIGS